MSWLTRYRQRRQERHREAELLRQWRGTIWERLGNLLTNWSLAILLWFQCRSLEETEAESPDWMASLKDHPKQRQRTGKRKSSTSVIIALACGRKILRLYQRSCLRPILTRLFRKLGMWLLKQALIALRNWRGHPRTCAKSWPKLFRLGNRKR